MSGAPASPVPDTPVVVAARRTPIATEGRALATVPVERLAATVLQALAEDVAPADLSCGEVILGNCMGPGGNPARVAALCLDVGPDLTGLTVDRQCGSGLEAIRLAGALVEARRASLVLAGGAESASTAPIRAWRPSRAGEPPRVYDRAPFAPPPYADPDMGVAADRLARARGITRARQDDYAARSHARAVTAYEEKRFAPELVPVAGLDRDDRPRPGFTVERLARLRPAFVPADEGGTVTAGNACGISDGAAAVAVVPEQVRARLGVGGLRVVDWECAGADPGLPGLGPVPAIRRLLARQGLGLDDIDEIEFVEAFAAQVLACADGLDLDPRRICPDGGAIALGHPWGASGAVLLVRLFTRMIRQSAGGRPPRLGLAAAAIGGGMGIACLVEAVPGPMLEQAATPAGGPTGDGQRNVEEAM